MPMIDLTYVRGSLDDPSLRRLTDELVTVLLRAERAPDTPFLRDNTIVYLHALDPAAQSVGGREPGEPRFRVEMTVFAGVLSQEDKEQLVADAHAAVCAAAGLDPEGLAGIARVDVDSRGPRRKLGRRRQSHLLPKRRGAHRGPRTLIDRLGSVRLWTSLVHSRPRRTPRCMCS